MADMYGTIQFIYLRKNKIEALVGNGSTFNYYGNTITMLSYTIHYGHTKICKPILYTAS